MAIVDLRATAAIGLGACLLSAAARTAPFGRPSSTIGAPLIRLALTHLAACRRGCKGRPMRRADLAALSLPVECCSLFGRHLGAAVGRCPMDEQCWLVASGRWARARPVSGGKFANKRRKVVCPRAPPFGGHVCRRVSFRLQPSPSARARSWRPRQVKEELAQRERQSLHERLGVVTSEQ